MYFFTPRQPVNTFACVHTAEHPPQSPGVYNTITEHPSRCKVLRDDCGATHGGYACRELAHGWLGFPERIHSTSPLIYLFVHLSRFDAATPSRDTLEHMMNNTVWWDGIDGNNLACSGEHQSDRRLTQLCFVVFRALPVFNFGPGLFAIYLGWLRRTPRHAKIAIQPIPQLPNLGDALAAQPKFQAEQAEGTDLSNTAKKTRREGNGRLPIEMVVGVSWLLGNLSFLVSGHGTMAASNTLQGMIGDALCKYVLSVSGHSRERLTPSQ
jgi:hypothetical protein